MAEVSSPGLQMPAFCGIRPLSLARMTTKKCPCGYDIRHPMVETKEHYSSLGWLLLFMGATPLPIRVDYSCTRCDVVLGTTTDKTVLRNYWQGGKR